MLLDDLKKLFGDLAGQDLTGAPGDATFFDLGFDSLFLTQASQALRKRFGVKITFRQLLEDLNSLDAMAAFLADKIPAPAAPPVSAQARAPAPAAPVAEMRASAASPGIPAAAAGSSILERILLAQHHILEQQIALLRGAPSPASAALQPPVASSNGAAVQPAPAKVEAKPFGPYRPIEKSAGTGFTERQQQHLDALIERYARKTPESKRRTQQNRRHFSDPRSVSGFRTFWKEMVYPIITVRSAGARFWDIDGNEYIDITMGFGTNLLGHNPAFIAEAIEEQLHKGIEVGPQSPLAGEVAELLCELTGHERAAFCNTGSEAVLAAVRIARTVTGRSRIATTSGFHGINDEVLVKANVLNGVRHSVPAAPGIPEHIVRDVLVLDYGTEESLELMRQHAGDLAAVLIEPVQSRHPDLQPRAFIEEARRITAENETALIFDEVINGFRCHLNGAQAHFGVKSDIGTWGKIIGGGMPIGAVTGSAQYMDALDGGNWQFGDASFPEVGVTFFAGTYVRHPLAMAASRAILRYLKQQGPSLQQRLNERTTQFVTRLNAFFREQGAPLHLEHFSSLFYPHFEAEVKYASLFYFHLREKGLHIWEGRPCFLSTAHTDADVEEIIRIFKESVLEMQRGDFLPRAGVELAEPEKPAPARPVEISAPVGQVGQVGPVRPVGPVAARHPMQFSLYFFGHYPAEYHEDKYRLIIESARFADANGFTALWLPERHFHAHGGFSPNPSVIAAALARETTRLQLRGGSVVLPLHHPVRVAEEWSLVDNLSGGRVGISIASGWHPNDFVFAPDAFENRRELALQHLATVQRLWRGETMSFPTGGQKQLDVRLHPMPRQRELPVWLTCIHKESFIKAGELGAGVLGYLMNQTIEDVAEKVALYREALERNGHDPERGHVTILLHTFVGADPESARAMARGPLREYLRTFLDNSQKSVQGKDGDVEMDADDVDYLLDRAFEDYASGKALIGSPESCAQIIERLQAIGVDEVGCFVDFGVSTDTALAHLPHLAELQRRCNEAAEKRKSAPILKPLTQAQKGLWAISHLGGEAARAYNEATTLDLRGALDLPALQAALNQVIARHEALRSTVSPDGESQIIHAKLELPIEFQDFSDLAPAARKGRLEAFFGSLEKTVFDFESGPLLKAVVVKLEPERHQLVLLFHHLFGNGPSYWIFFEELAALYEAYRMQRPRSLEAPMPFGDYLRWRAERAGGEEDRADQEFWLGQLSGELPVLDLPTDRTRPARRTFCGGRGIRSVDESLTRRLREAGARHRGSLFMLLFAAFKTWLARLSGQNDLIVGVPYESGARDLPGGNRLFANTTNMLPLRTRLDGATRFADLLAATKNQVLEAAEHQECFFGDLLPKLASRAEPGRPTLFGVTFNYETGKFAKDAGGLHFELITEDVPYRNARDVSPFDLVMNVAEKDGALLVECDFNADLFEAATIDRWLGHYHTLLEGIASSPETPLDRLPMLSEAERQQTLFGWNDTKRDYPNGGASLHALIEAQAARTPEAVAVAFERQTLSYRDLNRRANQMAHRLRSLGVGPDIVVAVAAERSLEMVIALLAVLKAGGAYLPLDVSYPADRLAFMLSDAKPRALLVQRAVAASLPSADVPRIFLEESFAAESDANPTPAARADDLAYVIYTSGSTGRPKGVMNTHRGIVNRLLWMQETYGLTAKDRVLQKTTCAFDVSVWEFFWPLLTGARLVMARPHGQGDTTYLVEAIQAHGITTLHFVPSMLAVFLDDPDVGRCAGLRRVICSGEALPFEVQERFFAKLPGVELHNLYGPTEAAVDVTFWPCQPGAADRIVPIGRPVANTSIHILDEALQPVPTGAAGELMIGGVQVARGYLGRPELTAEKFIANPYGEGRLYRTGDLARYRAGGVIEYLGRLDHQVKLRGFRIELGEIEDALRKHPAIRDAAVILREDAGEKRLAAYCVPRSAAAVETADATRQTIASVTASLRATLPDYMTPATFVFLDILPLSANGKLDRRALPAPDWEENRTGSEFVAPRNDTEEKIASAWRQILKVERIGVHDDFFDLGGHSLAAMQVVSRLRGSFSPPLNVLQMFEHPTIASLAEAIDQAASPSNDLDEIEEGVV